MTSDSHSSTRIYAGALLYALAAGTLVLVAGLTVVVWLAVSKLTDIAETNQANGRLLIECTTPPEARTPSVKPENAQPDDCYLRSRQSTGEAINQIGDLSIIAAACGAANPADIPATRDCVERAIQEREKE